MFRFEVQGTGSGDTTFTCKGEVTAHRGDIMKSCDDAMASAFQQLTQGKAIFGKPGVGCRGPYTITRFVIERVSDA